MKKKLTITIEEKVYKDLYSTIGRRKISKFIEKIIKPYVTNDNLKLAYQKMANDKQREKEAYEWEEGLIKDDFN